MMIFLLDPQLALVRGKLIHLARQVCTFGVLWNRLLLYTGLQSQYCHGATEDIFTKDGSGGLY